MEPPTTKPQQEKTIEQKESTIIFYPILLILGILLGVGGLLASGVMTNLHLDTNLADAVTIGLGVMAFIQFLFLWIIYQYSWKTTWQVLKAALWYKSYAMGGILTPDGRILLKAAKINDEVGSQWLLPMGKIFLEKRLADGTQLNGPDRVDYAIFTSEGMSSIDMREKADSELFGTSSYITKISDLKKAEGYIEGHEASKQLNSMEWLSQNFVYVLGFLCLVGVFLYVGWDKVVSGPQGWQAANACEARYGNLLATCSKAGVNVAALAPSTTIPQQSATGGQVVER